jgi:hypothetical protein
MHRSSLSPELRWAFGRNPSRNRDGLIPTVQLALACLCIAVGAATAAEPANAADRPKAKPHNLIVNGGFEEHHGIGTLPLGWHAVDENIATYGNCFGWIAPRVERSIGGIGPREGRFLVGIDTEMQGLDTSEDQSRYPHCALYQTITLSGNGAGKVRGTFSIHYNDLGTTALAHLTMIRLSYTIDHTDMSRIEMPVTIKHERPDPHPGTPGIWSEPFFRVSQQLPYRIDVVGDWTRASIPVVVDTKGDDVKLTLWIGIFDSQSSAEIGYYRIDDAAFVLDPPTTQPAGAVDDRPRPSDTHVSR